MNQKLPSDLNSGITRRTALKFASAGTLVALGIPKDKGWTAVAEASADDAWAKTHDRVWLGGEFWANPLEDWRVSDGGAECMSMGGGRGVHSLTHQVTKNGALTMTVTLTRLETAKVDGGASFRIGLRSEINEHRSNCFVQKGVNAGWQGDQLVLGPKKIALKDGSTLKQLRLTLRGVPAGNECALTLTANAVDYAVGNPLVGKAPNRYDKAHEKGSGFGFITFDTAKKTYLVESFRFLIDATDGKPSNQFPGWPAAIQQVENRGENVIG